MNGTAEIVSGTSHAPEPQLSRETKRRSSKADRAFQSFVTHVTGFSKHARLQRFPELLLGQEHDTACLAFEANRPCVLPVRCLDQSFLCQHLGKSFGVIPNIFRVWRDQGWAEPTFTQSFDPDRTVLLLPLSPIGSGKSAIKIGDKNKTAKRQLIIEYLTDHPDAKSAEIAEYIDLKPSRVRDYLLELIKENIVITSGGNRNRTYRLKF